MVPLPTPEEETRVKAQQERAGNALLERTCEQLLNKGIESLSVLARGGAASEIIGYVDKEKIDLIVAGPRDLSSFQGWLMGSVSRKLVHYSNCSVLIVTPPVAKKQSISRLVSRSARCLQTPTRKFGVL